MAIGVQVVPVTSIMTVMVGLKRILFPLQDRQLTAKQVSNSTPTVQRKGAARPLMAGGDSLANLGAYPSEPTKKIRRDKRQRDKENIASARAMPMMLNPMAKTAIMDSLAFLCERMPSKPPKPVSPSSIDLKSKTKKKIVVKGKNAKNSISDTRMPKKKKNGLMYAWDSKGASLSKAATTTFPAPAGLGAMFGAEFLAPIRTRPKSTSVEMPVVIETNPNSLGIVSPLAAPPCASTHVASDDAHSSHCPAHIQASAKTKTKKKKEKGTKKKDKSLHSDRMDSKGGSASVKTANESEKPKRRSKRKRQLIGSEESPAQKSPTVSMEIASNIDLVFGTILKDHNAVDIEVLVEKGANLRRSKRRLSQDNRCRTSPDEASLSHEPHIEPKEVTSKKVMDALLKVPHASSLSSTTSMTAKGNVSNRLRRSVAPPDRLGNPVSNPENMRTLRRGIRSTHISNCERSKEANKSVDGIVASQGVKEPYATRSIESDSSTWSSKELERLRKSHHEANPKSSSFWHDVAQLVGSRTADECQEKWFSFAKTPNQAAKSKKTKPLTTGTPGTKEDDIFNATPMKALFDLSLIFGSGLDLRNAEGLATLGIGSAIKVNVETASDKTAHQLKTTTHGYKTYIKNVKRDVNNCLKRKLPKVPKRQRIKETFTLKDSEGDFEVRGKLSPGGTLQVATEAEEHHDFQETENTYLSGDDSDKEACY